MACSSSANAPPKIARPGGYRGPYRCLRIRYMAFISFPKGALFAPESSGAEQLVILVAICRNLRDLGHIKADDLA